MEHCYYFTCTVIRLKAGNTNKHIPYSGKFSPGKNFAKSRCVVLRENFARFIFAHMRLGEIKFRGIINNYSFKRGSLAVSSSLEKCLAAAESPFSLAIWTSVHYLASCKAFPSPCSLFLVPSIGNGYVRFRNRRRWQRR